MATSSHMRLLWELLVLPYCRSVAEEQRSLALGVQSVLWRALGSIPGPILFGVIFDSSCVYWQFDCGRRGNCWVYNNNQISLRAYFITTVGVAVNLVCMVLCWVFYPPVTCANIRQKTREDTGDKELEGDVRDRTVKNPVFGDPGLEQDQESESKVDLTTVTA